MVNPKGVCATVCGVILALSFAGWAVQLGSVAALQASCEDDLPLADNDMDVIKENMANLRVLVASMTPAAMLATPQALPVMVQQSLGLSLKIMKSLSYRSTTSVFTFTPDLTCSMFYRYQWLNTALQFFALVVAIGALVAGRLYSGRLAVCCMLVVASIISIENAHTFLNVRDTAPELELLRGKVFFVGCIFTVACNLALTLVLGFEPSEVYPRASDAGSHGVPTGKAYGAENHA